MVTAENAANNVKIIAVVNQKGGVGKTTTAVNVATALAATGKKVLLIDLDPQGNASTGLGVDHRKRHDKNIYKVLLDNLDAKNAILKTQIPDLFAIASNVDLSAAEIELVSFKSREFVLKKAINSIPYKFDHIIIDCPPSLGLLTVNALTAASSIIIPLQCEFYALEGLSHLLNTVKLVKKNLNSSLEIEGIVLTMYDKRNRLTEQVEQDVREFLGQHVYKTVIPRNIKVSEAPSHGQPAIIYDYKCTGSMAYILLVKEILAKEKLMEEELAEAV